MVTEVEKMNKKTESQIPLDMSQQPELDLPFENTHVLLNKWSLQNPKKIAIVDLDQNGKSVTWSEITTLADRIAQLLIDQGVKPGDKVAVLSDENIEKLIIWMGIWRYGAAICPLNVEMNTKHLAEILDSIKPTLILCHQDLDISMLDIDNISSTLTFGEWAPELTPNTRNDELFSTLASYDDGAGGNINNNTAALDLSCIFCTSGTTSKPKSVVYNHLSYWLSGLSTLDMLGLTGEDRTLEYRSFGWNSAQILSLMPWLQTGLTMHIAKRFSRSRVFDWVRNNDITFAAGVPTVVNMLQNEPPPEEERKVPSLRLMTCSTAPLSPEQWTSFESMYGVTLLQLYGMSEAGWICGNRHYKRRMGTVGPPAKHQQLLILDSDGTKCPLDKEGEITVTGPQTCLGTISTNGKFEDYSLSPIKTGDLGIMDSDGFVTITGRTKDLIVRGGVNIAPLEIDNIIIQNPKVLEAATIGVPDQIYGEEIVTYVVCKTGEKLTERELQLWCTTTLPKFKTPKSIVFVSELPKSDRGKIRRDELKEKWHLGNSN